MKPKKNPKADLTRNIGLYFSIGLFFAMFFSWAAVEWKFYDSKEAVDSLFKMNDLLDEDAVPIVQTNTPPPPPPPPPPQAVAPVEYKKIENDDKTIEADIKSTEVDTDEALKIDDVERVKDEEEVDVPFAVIEDKPVFPGCEKVKPEKQVECFQEKLTKHINKYFDYPEAAKEMGIQGRVTVVFVISKDGSIVDVRAKGPDKSLEDEAVRIISKLPKMSPGKQRGNPVRVPYSIPITFRLQ